MKKWRSHFANLVLVGVVFFLVACEGAVIPPNPPPPTVSPDRIRLTFVGWGGWPEIRAMRALVRRFNEISQDVYITYRPLPQNYMSRLEGMIAEGNAPDILYIPDGAFPLWAAAGQLVNLQPYLEAWGGTAMVSIWPSAVERYRWDAAARRFGQGDLYALPKEIGPTALFINKDLFHQAGVPLPDPSRPLTWDEVVEIGRAITVDAEGRHPGEEGFDIHTVEVFGVGDLWFENVIYGNGGRIVDEAGREFVAHAPASVAAVQWLSDLIHVHQIHPMARYGAQADVERLFREGRVAMTTQGYWMVSEYRRLLDFDWDVRLNPVGPAGEIVAMESDCTSTGWSGSVGLAILKGTEGEIHAAEALRFLLFLTGPEAQIELAQQGLQIPNQQFLSRSRLFLEKDEPPEHREIFIEAARCQVPGPWTQMPLYDHWFSDLWTRGVWQSAVVEGITTAETAIGLRRAAFQAGLDEAWLTLP